MWFYHRFSFFFQAEDGIRDRTMTGVQTCALPIYTGQAPSLGAGCALYPMRKVAVVGERATQMCALFVGFVFFASGVVYLYLGRSEERRVGKEGRSGCWRWR